MNRLQEIEFKHEQVRAILDQHKADAMWILRTRNIAWFTAGADASIPADSEQGVYQLLVTRDKRVVVTSNIEHPRLRDEEDFESLGFEFQVYDWYGMHPMDNAGFSFNFLPPPPKGAQSFQHYVIGDAMAEKELFALRTRLTDAEQIRFRALGADAAAALDEAIRAVRPGDSEWQIAARLDAAVRARGGLAVVNLVAVDERINRFRHPLITNKTLDKYAMIVLCMRRGGLIVAATRLAHIGSVPDDVHEKARRVAYVDATAMVASKPGRALSDVFDDITLAYLHVHEEGQWQHHHQGGLIGYSSRERIAKPGEMAAIQVGSACAWNPSIVGYKSEDTILIGENGFEIVTAVGGDFPTIRVEVGGQAVVRPGVVEV
jgi:antitoxin VapB